MIVAVTAASGALGAAIVRATVALLGQEHVIAVARTPSKAEGLGVQVRAGDYDQRDQLERAFQGVDAVLLVSGMAAPDVRIGQHRNVIEAARAAGVSKLVYTSVQGPEDGTAFSPIVQSNRQTEADVRASGLAWAIGRNGIYIEPDVEYIETYEADGEIANCAGDGKCGYTTRAELAFAYARLLTEASLEGTTYRLHGEPITQSDLAEHLRGAFGTPLAYRAMSVEAYRAERIDALGPFLGGVIAGIYAGIRGGAYDQPSDYSAAAGRPHQSWADYFAALAA
ncbi:MAG: NAD(P)H-binding protein [Deltaproteobacteria bacterium]|nr:NAD(P)H-binding protein [Deltaproteobacteria bacterium]